MAEQKACNLSTVSTIASDDYLMAITDVVPENNVVEKISKADFIADIISTDSGNLLEVGTDDLLNTSSTITTQGNTFNGTSQLIQTTAAGYYPALDGSLITNISATIDKSVIQLGTCSTASATAEKAVTLSGFVLATGATIQVTFTNANTADTPTLNVNRTGAKAIYNEAGTAVGANNPAYFPAGSTVEFTYNGTNWVFKKRVVENYINGTSWYRVYSDGWIEQGGFISSPSTTSPTITLLKAHKDANYNIMNQASVFGTGVTYQPNIYSTPTTTNFVVGLSSTSYKFYWQTKGY